MFVSIFTLGCKLNQLESEAIVDSFRRGGFDPIPWDLLNRKSKEELNPLLMIVNTCTVTSMAEQKARRIIRKALKEQPEACLIVTGCYAQMDGPSLATLEESGRLFVIPGEMKSRLLDLPLFLKHCWSGKDLLTGLQTTLSGMLNSGKQPEPLEYSDGAFRFCPGNFSSHSRAFIKIQDGCDNRCSYCRVSLARGKGRSLNAKEVLAQLLSLEQRGFAEAVLTGVNISQYHDPLLPGLSGLLEFLLEGSGKIRLRLSSIEEFPSKEFPTKEFPSKEFSTERNREAFFKVIANRRIRPHFHLSLQSGSAALLAKMGRRYNPQDVEKTAAQLRKAREDPFLACDIITGFPGETDKDFEETVELCRKIGFAWIHAFPFSPRPGTAAFGFPGKVDEKIKTSRMKILTALARKGRLDYLRRWEGKEVEAVVESGGKLNGSYKPPCPGKAGFVPAVSENYLKLLVFCADNQFPAPGSLIRCRILRPEGSRFDALAERI